MKKIPYLTHPDARRSGYITAAALAVGLLIAPLADAKEGLNFRPAQTSERGGVASISDY